MPTAQATTSQESNGHKRPGPPLGTRNNLRHGLKSSALPPGCRKLEGRLNDLRRQLEDAVLDVHGEVSLVHALAILTAMRWERHAALAARWLRLEGERMSPGDRLNYSREIARASAARDTAVKELGLTQRNSDVWQTLHHVNHEAATTHHKGTSVQEYIRSHISTAGVLRDDSNE